MHWLGANNWRCTAWGTAIDCIGRLQYKPAIFVTTGQSKTRAAEGVIWGD